MKVEAGQMLTLAFPEQVYMKLVFASYGWPLLSALIGAVAGYKLAMWLELGPMMIDAVTLFGGVLLAWLSVRFFSRRKTANTILNSMNVTICLSSKTPNMCNGSVNKPGHL